MDRVEPAAGAGCRSVQISTSSRPGCRVHPGAAVDVLPEQLVDRPLPVLALEAPVAGADRLRLRQRHRVVVGASGVEHGRHLVVRGVGRLGDHVEAHDLPGRRQVVVVLQRQVLQHHLLPDPVLGEVDHDAVALRLADPERRLLLGRGLSPPSLRDERERFPRAQREVVGARGRGVEDAEQVLAPLDLQERRGLAVDQDDVAHQRLLAVVDEQQLAVRVEDLVLDDERDVVAALAAAAGSGPRR